MSYLSNMVSELRYFNLLRSVEFTILIRTNCGHSKKKKLLLVSQIKPKGIIKVTFTVQYKENQLLSKMSFSYISRYNQYRELNGDKPRPTNPFIHINLYLKISNSVSVIFFFQIRRRLPVLTNNKTRTILYSYTSFVLFVKHKPTQFFHTFLFYN